jgi:hypothetical protein
MMLAAAAGDQDASQHGGGPNALLMDALPGWLLRQWRGAWAVRADARRVGE